MPGRPYQRAFGALKRRSAALPRPLCRRSPLPIGRPAQPTAGTEEATPSWATPCRRSSAGLDLGALTAAGPIVASFCPLCPPKPPGVPAATVTPLAVQLALITLPSGAPSLPQATCLPNITTSDVLYSLYRSFPPVCWTHKHPVPRFHA